MKSPELNVSYLNDLPTNHLRQGVRTCSRQSHGLIRLLAISLAILPMLVAAQIVSNLGESNNNDGGVNSTAWNAASFTTGSNAGGYTLTSATMLFGAATGSPSNFEARIFDNNSGEPGNILGSLSGSSPSTAGTHDFTTSGINLTANTTYFLVSTAEGASGNGFENRFTSSTSETSSDGWAIGDAFIFSNDQGTTWHNLGAEVMMFSISATPVPEPHEYAMLVGLGLMGFVVARRHLVSKALT